MQFVWRDSYDMTIFRMHVADAEEVLTTPEEVMIKFTPETDCRKTRTRVFGKWVQSEAIGVKKDDIKDEGGSGYCQWPDGDEVEAKHGVASPVASVSRRWKSPTSMQPKDLGTRKTKSQIKTEDF